MTCDHDFEYTNAEHRTGNFDENAESLYFFELKCTQCGDKQYEQYHFEDTITAKQLEALLTQ